MVDVFKKRMMRALTTALAVAGISAVAAGAWMTWTSRRANHAMNLLRAVYPPAIFRIVHMYGTTYEISRDMTDAERARLAHVNCKLSRHIRHTFFVKVERGAIVHLFRGASGDP